MIEKNPIDRTRLRRLPHEGFSWIDRRFIRAGFLRALTPQAAFLYFFLAAVSDRDGLSFYGDKRVSELLGFAPGEVEAARSLLVRRELVLFNGSLYQLLPLPAARPSAHPDRRPTRRTCTTTEPLSLAAILREAMRRAGSIDSSTERDHDPRR